MEPINFAFVVTQFCDSNELCVCSLININNIHALFIVLDNSQILENVVSSNGFSGPN